MNNAEVAINLGQNCIEGGTILKKGITLSELLTQKDIEHDETAIKELRLILEQNQHLSHVGVVFILPQKEPNTGGVFRRVKIDENTVIPTVFIVSEDADHIKKLFNTRRSSAERIAKLLGINFEDMSPKLLRQFIIAHEFGHANDYVRNYEENPDYKGAEAAEEWGVHYEMNLQTMPVRGLDPVELQEEIANFQNLADFLNTYPEETKTINRDIIKSLEDLVKAQEQAYRSSEYERYADKFAIDFIRKNVQALNVTELQFMEK